MPKKGFRTITVSDETYEQLEALAGANESLADVVKCLLKKKAAKRGGKP
jgi:predicted CopG family antitoxin